MTQVDGLIDEETPDLPRWGIGDCEMLWDRRGGYVQACDMVTIIDWLTDNDDRDVMLARLVKVREALR